MKNPFRKQPLTDASLKCIREQGDPYTRLLIPLGRKRVIALVGFTERELHDEFETWMEEVEDAERQAGRVVEFGHAKPWGEPLKDGESVADVTTVSSKRREWVRCMGDDGKGCRIPHAHCICIDDPQSVMADWDGRGIETPLLPQSDGEGASMACMRPVRVSTIPPRGSTVPGGGIEPLYDPEGSFERRKLDRYATEAEGGVCPNPKPGIRCEVCGESKECGGSDAPVSESKYLADMRAAGVPIHDLPVNACADLPDPGLVERPEGMTHDGLDRRFTCVNCDRPYAEHGVGAIGAPLWCPSTAGLLAGMWKQKPR